MSQREAAVEMGVSKGTFGNLLKEASRKIGGKLPAPVRLGRSVRWPLAEVQAWLDTRGPRGELLSAKEWSERRRK